MFEHFIWDINNQNSKAYVWCWELGAGCMVHWHWLDTEKKEESKFLTL